MVRMVDSMVRVRGLEQVTREQVTREQVRWAELDIWD